MLKVPIVQARAGMVLATPIMHPVKPEMVLLRSGFKLGAREIEKLAEMRVRELWVKFPGLEFVSGYFSSEVQAAQRDITAHLSKAFDMAVREADPDLQYHEYRSSVAALLDALSRCPQARVFMQELAEAKRPGMRHGTTVCLLSMLLGLKLDFYMEHERTRLTSAQARDTTPLGVGALLHDIGMTRIEARVLEDFRVTQDVSDTRWQQHVLIGYGMVNKVLEPSAANIVLHHHQRMDGTGFPAKGVSAREGEGLRGSDIHIFSRIVFAADLFDRLRHGPGADDPSVPVTPRPAVRVLSRLRQNPFKQWVDPMVMRALMSVVPAYAPGSLVKLSDGRVGAVASWDHAKPCRPSVFVFKDGEASLDRADARGERVDLTREPSLSIIEAEGQDVSRDNFDPAPGEFDLEAVAKSMANRADDLSRGMRKVG
ncbi:MAG: HD domain-containing protein [Phycisphaerales bacterium]|nr:HD domain-containing protein [Phycisphaerales bacterium]